MTWIEWGPMPWSAIPPLDQYLDAFPGRLVERLPQIQWLERWYDFAYPSGRTYWQMEADYAEVHESVYVQSMFEEKDDRCLCWNGDPGSCRIANGSPHSWDRQDWRPGRSMNDAETLQWAQGTRLMHAHTIGYADSDSDAGADAAPVPAPPHVRGRRADHIILDECVITVGGVELPGVRNVTIHLTNHG